MCPTLTISEFEEAIQKRKNHKATRKDCSENVKTGIRKNRWKKTVVCSIYKKSEKIACEKYRVITTLNAAYKLLSQIFFFALWTGDRLQKNFCTLCQVFLKHCCYLVPMNQLFFDFGAAYNRVERVGLRKIMDDITLELLDKFILETFDLVGLLTRSVPKIN